MKSKPLILCLITILSTFACFAQTTIILKPNAETGKDAIISFYSPDKNFKDHPEFFATAWTKDGNTLNVRSLIKFDLEMIPPKATILSAELSLYSFKSVSNGAHSTLNGSNKCYLYRITSEWEENTVTWNNQPSYTEEGKVTLPASENEIQHYTNIDVTGLVRKMVEATKNNHGFMLKLETEIKYRRMVFASSDNPNEDLRPELKVTFINPVTGNLNTGNEDVYLSDSQKGIIMKSPDGSCWKGLLNNKGKLKFTRIECPDNSQTAKILDPVSIFFNKADNYVTIKTTCPESKNLKCKIFDSEGQLVKQDKVKSGIHLIDLSVFQKGEYTLNIYDKSGNEIAQKKILRD